MTGQILKIQYLVNSTFGKPNLDSICRERSEIKKNYKAHELYTNLPQTKQQLCSTVNSFAVLPGKLVKQGQQNGLFGELQTC